jgi:uncharacterized RDD family membrane protein YckC
VSIWAEEACGSTTGAGAAGGPDNPEAGDGDAVHETAAGIGPSDPPLGRRWSGRLRGMSDYPPPPMPSRNLGRRFAARLLDTLILLIPVLIVTVVIGGGFNIGTQNDTGREFVATLVGLLITLGYFVLCENESGHTPGKSALGLTVTGPEGHPTVLRSLQRNAFMLLSAIPGTVGGLVTFAVIIVLAVSIGTNAEGRGLHDRWAGVRVEHRG